MLKRGFPFAPGYKLEQFLGRGQFGQVWRASAPGGTAAAVKFIDLNGSEGHKEYAGIKRVKLIRHANLMPITAIWLLDAQGQVLDDFPDEAVETMDFGAEATASTAPYQTGIIANAHWLVVAMLLGGKSLHDRLRECRKEGQAGIPPRELISYIEDSAKGLDFLNSPQHDLGEGPVAIQHCDVKPANIVLMGSSAVVCDFGLAKILSRNQVTATSAAGTPAYMAPEAIDSRPSRTTDQYSLALSYYHLRTGTLPTADGSVWQILDAHRRGLLDLSGVTEPEQQVLKHATALEWSSRFESCADFADALRDALRASGQTKPGAFTWTAGAPHPSVAALHAQGSNPAVPTAVTMQPPGTAIDASAIPAAVTNNDPTATLENSVFASPTEADVAAKPSISITNASSVAANSAIQTLIGTAEATLRETPSSADKRTVSDATVTATSRPKIQIQKAALLVGGIAVALLLISSVFFRGSGQKTDPSKAATQGKEDVPSKDIKDPHATIPRVTDQENKIDSIYALVDRDYDQALTLFKTALDDKPELATVKPVSVIGHQNGVVGLVFDPRSERLVSFADDHEPFVHSLTDLDSKPALLKGHTNILSGVAFHPHKPFMLSAGSDRQAILWNWESNQTPTSKVLPGLTKSYVVAFVWHPSELAFVAIMDDAQIGIWDVSTNEVRHRLLPGKHPWIDVKFDSSGEQLILLADPGKVFVCPWSDLKQTLDSEGDVNYQATCDPAQMVKRIAVPMAADGKRLVTGGEEGDVNLWELDKTAKRLASSPDAHLIDGTPDPVEPIAVSQLANGPVFSGDMKGNLHIWWPDKQHPSTALRIHRGYITGVALSEDGRWGAAVSQDGLATFWDLASSSPSRIDLYEGEDAFRSVAIDPHGKWLVAGTEQGKIIFWPLAQLKLLVGARPATGRPEQPSTQKGDRST